MPRIRPAAFWQARRIGRHCFNLLPQCRDVRSAQNELRWMREHSVKISTLLGLKTHNSLLESHVARRCRGEPLQYILESQFFGALEVRCRPGVLIPREETATSITHLVRTLNIDQSSTSALRVLDLCTGTGCIPLLFHHEFYAEADRRDTALELVGVDVAGAALSVARENLIQCIADQRNFDEKFSVRRRSLQEIGFVQADVLQTTSDELSPDPPPVIEALERWRSDENRTDFDILIANPPYISPREFLHTTSRSVRLFEPQLALVPASAPSLSDIDIGDRFYPRLLEIALQVEAKVVLFEVADMAQAQRIVSMAIKQGVWDEIEVWRDEPEGNNSAVEYIHVDDLEIGVHGLGNGRSVVARRRRPSEVIPVLEHEM